MSLISLMILAASIAASPTTKQSTPSIEIRPPAINLGLPPEKETSHVCVFRNRNGAMNVLSASATDPAAEGGRGTGGRGTVTYYLPFTGPTQPPDP